MTDARDEGYTNEEWNARALSGGRLWDLGGDGRNTCSAYCSNVDLMSKQCVPGEQSVVFSVSEILLRMMGQDDICYELQEESTWEDVMNATVAMDKRFDEEDEDEEEAEEDEDDKVVYSEAFRNLVLAFRRRTFTPGGVDALLDLHTARAVVRDFVATQLQTTPEECTAAFGAMVQEFAAKSASSTEEEDEEDEEDEVDGADGRGGVQVPRLPDLEPGPQGQEGEVQDGGSRALREAPPGAGPVGRGGGRRGHLPQGSALQRPPARGLAHHGVVPQRVLVLRPTPRRDPRPRRRPGGQDREGDGEGRWRAQ